ncbi:hypothetical protein BBP40_008156 [Aspergillus hancockii]|nr:hypothetical protein BBP40_008156 [Aspergillus hancockii]
MLTLSYVDQSCFIVVGANDGTYGALVPYLCDYYEVDYATVSVVFLAPCAGYVAAALVSNWTHARFGHRGISLLGSGFHILPLSLHSICPNPVLVLLLVLAGLGNGLLDAAWNAWIRAMADSSRLMGILHGFYGLGAALAPLTATCLITNRGWHWYQYYYFMAGGALIEILTLTTAFWSARGSSDKMSHQNTPERTHGKPF